MDKERAIALGEKLYEQGQIASDAAVAKAVLKDKDGEAILAVVIIEGPDTDLFVRAIDVIEDSLHRGE